MPFCRRWFECGTLERWCKVQLTYCAGAERALQCAMSPVNSLRMAAPPEAIIAVLRDALAAVKVVTAAALLKHDSCMTNLV